MPALACCASPAWASYGNMKLEGLAFAGSIVLLDCWAVLLALILAAGWAGRKLVVVLVTLVTAAAVGLLIAAFDDGSASLRQLPLGGWAMFAVLSMAMVPAMLAAPVLQFAAHARGHTGRLPTALLVSALLLALAGSAGHLLLLDRHAERALGQARALAPGQLLPHVTSSHDKAAASWLSPYLWTAREELKWIIIGVGHLNFIESPAPISSEDTQALALLVSSSVGNLNGLYTGRLEGKLLWDRLVPAAAPDRAAVAAGLTEAQAQRFSEYFGVPHADWLCAPLADAETAKALEHLWTLLTEHEQRQLSAAVRGKCNLVIGTPRAREKKRRPYSMVLPAAAAGPANSASAAPANR